MSNLHNSVINYKDIHKLLPRREHFLEDGIYKKVSQVLDKNKSILFHPTALWDDKPMQNSKYDKSKYKVVLFGILEDGRKMSVVVNDITPYFEIKIPDNYNKEERKKFSADIFDELNMENTDYAKYVSIVNKTSKQSEYWKIEPIEYKIVSGRPFKYFQENKSYYVQIYFNKIAHRKDAIKYVRAKGYETAHDDLSCYYRVASRDYLISFGNWIVLSDYIVQEENDYIKDEVIQISINNIFQLDENKHSNLILDYEVIKRDKTLTMCWDIETFNSLDDGDIPQPECKDHNVFMIGITFQWYHSPDQILRICLVDSPSAPHPDFLTIICPKERDLLYAFSLCIAYMKPEIIMGFNDASYDWKWVINRGKMYKGLLKEMGENIDLVKNVKDDKSVLYNYKPLKIKIEADVNAEGNNLQLNGYIPVDVMIVFRQLYPTSEKWSLNFFLKENKLGGKKDMPYQEMFKIYDTARKYNQSGEMPPLKHLEDMKLVAEYCVIDAQRCHELMKIRSVIKDKREVANLSYTSIFDAFYRANGMKVRNLVISECNLRGLKISNISNEVTETGKYPGAWVFPPIKGLSVSKLSINERIEKAKMGYEEYADWLELQEDELKKCKDYIHKYGAFLKEDETPAEPIPEILETMLKETTGRPITGLDFSSLYPSLIMTYNLSPEYIIVDKHYAREIFRKKDENGNRIHNLHKIKFEFNGRTICGWSIRHDNKMDKAAPDYKFGLFPAILKELFDARKKLKEGQNGLEYWEHRIEELLLISEENPEKWKTAEIQAEFEDVKFNHAVLDSKQKALKVFMNTFYGEAGNKRSPLFMLQIAGGITTAGRENIKAAYKFVTDRECKVYYGDSVAADTPIIIKNGDVIEIKNINDIPTSSGWFEYAQFKPGDLGRTNKQQHIPVDGLEIWTSSGWSKIKRVIRHKTNKKMYRINTAHGIIDVTEDHSLLSPDKTILKPTDIKIGDELLHGFPQEKCFECMHFYSSRTVRVKSKLSAMKYYCLIVNDGYYCSVDYDELNAVYILNRVSKYKTNAKYEKCITCNHYEYKTYKEEIEMDKKIKKIIELPAVNQYVYDIETADGTFLGGIGSIIVKNTDSLYISMPEKEFKELDYDFYTEKISKLEYWKGMVSKTFEIIKPLNTSVNNMFKEDNGTGFLKMAYEEALYPVLFTAKKKYVGTPHVSAPNFDKNVPLFIRGLELKKRGVSEILKNVCNDILRACVSPENILTVIELVQNKIHEIYTKEWRDEFDAFIMTGVYKPNKMNVKMHTFYDRMKIERNITLTPGERINYVIVKKYPFNYDIKGKKTKLSIGDKMEIAEIAKEENMKIDLDYYMEKSINGQLARFITYHRDFQPAHRGEEDLVEMKKTEDDILKKARKYVDAFCKAYYTKYDDMGVLYKNIYKTSANIIKDKFNSKYQEKDLIKLINLNPGDDLETWLLEKIIKIVEKKKHNINYGADYINSITAAMSKEEKKKYIIQLQDVYYANKKMTILWIVEKQYNERKIILETRFKQSLGIVQELYKINNFIAETLTNKVKVFLIEKSPEVFSIPKKEIILEKLDDDELYNTLNKSADEEFDKQAEKIEQGLNELKYIYNNLISNYEYVYQIRSIVKHLKSLRDKHFGIIKTPDNKELKNLIKNNVDEMMKNLDFEDLGL